MARPTDYKDEYVDFVLNYIDECQESKSIPYMEDIALQLNVDEDTITNWCKVHDQFFGAIKKLKILQKKNLQQLGLSGKIRASMPIFLLKANHGMIETSRHIIDDDGKLTEDKQKQAGRSLIKKYQEANGGK